MKRLRVRSRPSDESEDGGPMTILEGHLFLAICRKLLTLFLLPETQYDGAGQRLNAGSRSIIRGTSPTQG